MSHANTQPEQQSCSVEYSATECHSLGCLLDQIDAMTDDLHEVSMRDIVAMVGRRWYGPLLVIPGVIMMTPVIGDIPGVPILMGIIVILISTQLLWQKKSVWLPRWILNKKIDSAKVSHLVSWVRPPSRVVDKLARPRIEIVVKQAGLFIISIMSIIISATTPFLELIPFSATLAGIAITLFGISVLSRDGAIALVAIAFSLATLSTVSFLLF